IRSLDADVVRYLKIFTHLPPEEIAGLDARMAAHPELREAQRRLAEEVTRAVHGEKGLTVARQATEALFGGSLAGMTAETLEQIFADVPSATLPRSEIIGRPLSDVAAAA